MNFHRRICLVLLAAATLATSPVARAADTLGDTEKQAAECLRRGNKAYREGRLAEAELAYREAFALRKGYDIAGDLGMAELAQGKARAAAEHLAFSLRHYPITGDPSLRDEMKRAFANASKRVATLHVTANVEGAEILVDGVPVGAAPLADDVFVEPGVHTVEARLAGHSPVARGVKASAAARLDIALSLAPLPASTQDTAALPPPRKRSVVPAIVLGGLAATGAGVGIALLTAAGGMRSDADAAAAKLQGGRDDTSLCTAPNAPSTCAALTDTAEDADTTQNVAVGAFVGAGALAAGAVIYLLWPSPPPNARGATAWNATPFFDGDRGGLSLSLTF